MEHYSQSPEEKGAVGKTASDDVERISFDSLDKGDILSQEHTDPVLNAKMHLVNNAIDEIGFTGYHAKLFVLNGFGYATDSLILLIQSIIATQAAYEFHPSYTRGLTIAAYVGMLVGALFWGISADVIGRRFAFNVSLIVSSIFAIVAGASPSWVVLGVFVCLSAFGAGGNLVLDTAVFLEYLPSRYQWLLTLLASWWGVGQLIAGLFAWAVSSKSAIMYRSVLTSISSFPTTAHVGQPVYPSAHTTTTKDGDTSGTPTALSCSL